VGDRNLTIKQLLGKKGAGKSKNTTLLNFFIADNLLKKYINDK